MPERSTTSSSWRETRIWAMPWRSTSRRGTTNSGGAQRRSAEGPRSGRQPPSDAAVVGAGPAARLAEAVCAVAAPGGGAGRRTVVRSPNRRWDPLAASVDVAAARRSGGVRRLKGEEFFGDIAGRAVCGNAAPSGGAGRDVHARPRRERGDDA